MRPLVRIVGTNMQFYLQVLCRHLLACVPHARAGYVQLYLTRVQLLFWGELTGTRQFGRAV